MAAMIREAREEIGVKLAADDLRLASTVHWLSPEGIGRIGLFFAADHDPLRMGEPTNAEPHKCAKLQWFPLSSIPVQTFPYNTIGIDLFMRGESFAVANW